MKRFETANYIFHYEEDSPAAQDIEKIASVQESCFSYICQVLQVKPEFRIQYFLCGTPEQVGEIYGDNVPCNGFASMPDKVYAVYNERVKCIGFHEDAHIISYCINRPESAAIREGLAMFFDRKWWGISNLEWTGYFLKKGMYAGLSEYLKDDVFFKIDCGISYPVAGCLTEYLILTFGMERYRLLWAQKGDMAASLERVYGRSVEALDDGFRAYLGLFRMDEAVEARIEALVHVQ